MVEGNANKNNFYLSSYHAGAGLNAAVFTKQQADAIVGHLNGTKLQFELGEYPYQLELPGPESLYGDELAVPITLDLVI